MIAVLLAGVLWLLAAGASFRPDVVSNDGAQYLSVAANMQALRGNATSVLFYEQHFAARALPSPQTVFQPAYPLAVATSTALGVPLAWSGFAVSALLHLASAALLVSLLMRATGLAPSVAAAITILWLCLAANFSVVVDALSEPMLVFATLASAWCYARSLRAHRRIAWLFASGLCALLAFEARYAGLFFVAGAGLALALQWLRNPSLVGFKGLCAWGALPALGIAATFARNQLLVGSLTGGPAAQASHSVREFMINLYWSVSRSLGWALDESALELLAMSLALASIVLWLGLAMDSRRRPLPGGTNGHAPSERPLLWMAAGYLLVSLAALAWMSLTSPVSVSMRYLQPLWPFVCILAAAAFRGNALETAPRHQVARLAAGILLFVALAIGQLTVYRDVLGALRSPEPRTSIERVLTDRVAGMTLRECVQRILSVDEALMTNEPQQVALALARPTLGLPVNEYATRTWDGPAARQLMQDFAVRRLLFLRDTGAGQSSDTHEAPFFADLRAHRVPHWLEPVVSGPGYELYVARDDAARVGPAASDLPCARGQPQEQHLGL